MLTTCMGCGGLMWQRADGIEMCLTCRGHQELVLWAKASELKQKLDKGQISDWEFIDHRRAMNGLCGVDALIQFDDLVRPYFNEVMRKRGYR